MPYSVKDIDEMIASVERLGKAAVDLYTAANDRESAGAQETSFQKIKERLEKVRTVLTDGNEEAKAKAQAIAEKIRAELNAKITDELPAKITIPAQMKESEKLVTTEYNSALASQQALDSRLMDIQLEEALSGIAVATAPVRKGKAPAARSSASGADPIYAEIEKLTTPTVAPKPTVARATEASNTSPASKVDPGQALIAALEEMQGEAIRLIQGMNEQMESEMRWDNSLKDKYKTNPPMGKFTEQHVNMAFNGTKAVLSKPGANVEQTVRSMSKFINNLNEQINEANPVLGRDGDVSRSAYCINYFQSIDIFKQTAADLMVSNKTVTSSAASVSSSSSAVVGSAKLTVPAPATAPAVQPVVQPGKGLLGRFLPKK
jgi:hypothetical protein